MSIILANVALIINEMDDVEKFQQFQLCPYHIIYYSNYSKNYMHVL